MLERVASAGQDEKTELEDVRRRDQQDQSREVAPLRPAEDAVVIDTDSLGVEDVIARAIELTTQALEHETAHGSTSEA
jgi:cytidylate kinase